MARMGLIAAGALLIALTSVLGQTEDHHHWPNFSCHTANSSVPQGTRFRYHRMGWRSCLESYQKYKGNCAHLCVLAYDRILRRKAGEPVTFDIDAFIIFFAEELGYSLNGTAGPEQELMNKIRSAMESCKINHPEYKTMKSLRKTPCGPWKKFLGCFDEAIGCGVWEIDEKN